ncbi:PREDICTED: class I SAM-dependent methyltransferase [Prunus dulcis]|uniref:PREDICTED: class I SAM-dependent methyltransferase n=1 Tax=Prunus dulcis TaxID=3755 RepID=A0A5E4FBP2_PRUDU|nr:uncharacterized protein LOC117618319 [Prunus dulcis]VVA25534.1 PREDICTED: class I SAM-dependent methyltransferase [Prunus dulcis]
MNPKPPTMKEDYQKKLTPFKLLKPIAYLLLLLLSFTLGYLSSPSSPTTPSFSPPTPQLPQLVNLPTQLDHFRLTTHCATPLPSHLIRQTILDRLFNSTSPFVNFPPPYATPLLQRSRVKGWGSKGAVFQNLIQKVQPKTIIEIGTFLGASAIHMARLTSQLGLKDTQILCLDDFRGWPGFHNRFGGIGLLNGDVLLLYQFMQNVVSVNATETVLPIPFSTGSGLDWLCEMGVYGDLIEVDAGHDFNSAWSDIIRAYRLLRPGGVIFGHDYFTAADDHGVRRAVTLFARVYGLKIKLDGQHWVIESS